MTKTEEKAREIPQMKLFFVRHGEAVTPKIEPLSASRLSAIDDYGSGLYTGDLTEKGRIQAQSVARYLEGKGVSRLLASPVPRALQTGEIAAEHLGLPLEVTEDLKEIAVGYLDPLNHRLLRLQMSAVLRGNDLYHRFTGKPVFLPVALYFVLLYLSRWIRGKTRGGEPRPEVNRRLERVLARATDGSVDGASRQSPDSSTAPASGSKGIQGSVALFTHGYLIYYLANHLIETRGRLFRLAKAPYVRNGSITEVEKRGSQWKLNSYASDEAVAGGSLGIAGG